MRAIFPFRNFLLLAALEKCVSLSSIATEKRPLRRVAVIGSGIAGLSVAQSLRSPNLKERYQTSDDFQVSLYDARTNLDASLGAGIQLNGGLAVLEMINPTVQEEVVKAGLPTTRIQSRCKSWDADKEFDKLLELDLKEAVQGAGDEVSNVLIRNGQLQWTNIMRGALQDVLFKTLPKDVQQKAKFGKSLTDIRPLGNGEVECVFSDGTVDGPFDIVVGCDGVKSACKEFIENGRISEDADRREGDSVALYSGLRIRYAVKNTEEKSSQAKTAQLTQSFGNGGYGLQSVYGDGAGKPNKEGAFLVYLDDDYIGPFKKKNSAQKTKIRENADWSQDINDRNQQSRDTMLEELRTLQVPSTDMLPVVQDADSFFELGVYFHNPFSLRGWSREVNGSDGSHVVLVGDAAHALPPFLGQGSNQAIQDAFCLATKLYEYNSLLETVGEEDLSIKTQLKDYENTRWLGCFSIFWKALFLGYLEVGGEGGLYSKFRDVFFKTMGIIGVAKKILLTLAMPQV